LPVVAIAGAWFAHRFRTHRVPEISRFSEAPNGPAEAILRSDKDWKTKAEELRRLYPYESVADRLTYENGTHKAPPVLSAAAASRLAEEEDPHILEFRARRAESLKVLHSNEVEGFINRPGFGFYRTMPRTSPHYLDLPASEPIPFDPSPSPALESEEIVSLPRDDKDPSPPVVPGLPPVLVLDALHDYGVHDFAGAGRNGHVKERRNVAGFRSHQFYSKPDLNTMMPGIFPRAEEKDRKERWQLSRLELVSLLKHDTPLVYVSEHLPRMDDARKGKTRPLTDFEKRSLEDLEKGEDLVTAATANHIAMLGSLRASQQCLGCHEVARGALLGAFSYDLHRDPPVKAAKPAIP
jgi:hypothetical protein